VVQSGNAAGPQAHVDKANVASYDYSSVRARPGRFSALRVLHIRVLRSKYMFCAARLHGRAGRSTDKHGCCRPGQVLYLNSKGQVRCIDDWHSLRAT
jgi:hypothetical protein